MQMGKMFTNITKQIRSKIKALGVLASTCSLSSQQAEAGLEFSAGLSPKGRKSPKPKAPPCVLLPFLQHSGKGSTTRQRAGQRRVVREADLQEEHGGLWGTMDASGYAHPCDGQTCVQRGFKCVKTCAGVHCRSELCCFTV